ncbi:MAG: hypothetical protein KGN02_11720 [bacterium]|nr:hypothetical protein [bacterium]
MLLAIATIAGALGSARIAGAAPPPVVHPIDEPPHPIIPHPIVRHTLPPLPFASVSPVVSPSPGASSNGSGPSAGIPAGLTQTTWHIDRNAPRLHHVPKLSKFLVKVGKGQYAVRPTFTGAMARYAANAHMRPMAGDGSTIILTGDQYNYFENDITVSYGTEIYVLCENMPYADTYRYYVYPPDGSGPYSSGNIGTFTSSGNRSCNNYGIFNLSTPFTFNNPTTVNGSAYPGVWVIAMYDVSKAKMITETNIVASASFNFNTYSDVAESTPALDFTQGGTIAVGATGLNPNHYYAVGWVYSAGSGLPCEYSVPSVGTGKTGVCFTGTVTGVQAFSGNFEQWWNSSSSPSTTSAPTGTYDVELYDATTSEMIGHQQVSMEPSTSSWTLTPYNSSGATPPPGLSYDNIFATDGLSDQSTTGLTYAASGLSSTSNGHTIRITVSNPNGVVLNDPLGGGSGNYPVMTTNPTTTQSGGAISKQVAFPYDATELMAYGPTQNPFAPNVLTAQLYDTTLGSVIASKSFQVLAYAANFSWAGGTVVNAAPGTGVTESVTITNTGNQNFGTWNGDGINGVEIAPNATYNEQLNLVDTTATDSAGNTWTIFSVGSGKNLKIYAEPTSLSSGANLPVGGTLTFNISIQVANGQCNSSPCYFDTGIRPRHGVAYSGLDSVSNALGILANGVSPSSVVATATWSVQSESATANMAARRADYDHLTYVQGTANAPSSDYYTVNLTINNASSPGGNKLMDLKVVMPSVLDMTTGAPTVLSPGGWSVITQTGTTNLGGSNVFELTCNPNTKNGCGISSGSSQTFSLKFPVFTGSFVEQDTAMTANFDGGGCGNCNATSYPLNATNTTVNGIAGITNTDSLMLGGFSLNPTLMYMTFSPSTVGTGVATSATMVFNNTSTSQDPNPDYVDQVNLVFPAAIDPSSITVPTGWIATQTSTNNWQIALCSAPTNTTPCSTNETSAVAPGGSLSMTLNYNAPGPTAGTYNVKWYVTGANGGEDTSAITENASVTFSATSASVKFTTVNGVAVPSGTEPQTGTDATTNGSTFVYTITNTGASTLNNATITIPHTTRGNTSGGDATGQYWQLTSAPTVSLSSGTGTSGTCNGTLNAAQYTNPTSSADGTITLSGCSVPTNGVITVTMVLKTPYLIGSDFLFSSTVKSGATLVSAQPAYSSSNAMLIVINGILTVVTPGNGSVGGANVLTAISGSGATPSTSCTGCSVTTGSPALVDFGVFSGTFTTTDIVDASVMSDANSPNSWTLYISSSTNPANMLYNEVDSTHSSSATGLSYSNNTSYTLVPTTSPGTQLSTYTGTGRHAPSDTIQNFQVQTGGNTSPESVTITYTLVFN